MKHIITVDEIRDLGRPISSNIDNDKLLSYIYETERLNIKPILGDQLFSELLKKTEENLSETDRYYLLLNGGDYEDKRGSFHMFSGLKIAMSYFVYAQYVMDGDFQLTRAGVVVKDNAYSSHVSSKERSDCYNNALTAANGFINEVKDFVKALFSEFCRRGSNPGLTPTSSIIIHKIGE